ncbi:Bifunctional pantoate ligase/cytidylate kinase [Bienertia sinuspersici]
MSSNFQDSNSSVHPQHHPPNNHTTTTFPTGRIGPKIRCLNHHLSSSTNPNHGVICLFKDFREFKEESVQQWVNSWLKIGPIVVPKISRQMFIFHCILEDDKRSLLHHTTACFHASFVIFKDWQEYLALRDYKFADSAIWVRVEGIPAVANHTSIALNILNRKLIGPTPTINKGQGVAGFFRKPLIPGVFLGLENGTTRWVDIRYEGVFIFCKRCGMIGHKEIYCRTPLEKAKKRIWETILNICNQEKEHLVTPQLETTLYTNKIKGLKGTLKIKQQRWISDHPSKISHKINSMEARTPPLQRRRKRTMMKQWKKRTLKKVVVTTMMGMTRMGQEDRGMTTIEGKDHSQMKIKSRKTPVAQATPAMETSPAREGERPYMRSLNERNSLHAKPQSH